MKQVKLAEEICALLNKDETDYNLLALYFGKQALPTIKKIIATGSTIAPKAIVLDETIRQREKSLKRSFSKSSRVSFTMRSITTHNTEEHIKGFGSDMMKRRK